MKTWIAIVVLGAASMIVWNASSPVAAAAADSKTKKKPADTPPPTYTDDIKPFIESYCSDCHSGAKAKGGYNFESVASMEKTGKKGPAVVPGKPMNSRMILALAARNGVKPMPPKDKDQPSNDDKKKVYDWIQAGAKETAPDKTADADDTKKKPDDSDDKPADKPVKGKPKSN